MTWVEIALWLVAGVWVLSTLKALRDLASVPDLPALDSDPGESAHIRPARVSVIVPARDEAERIGASIERLLGQRGVELEVIVVDDRSRDDTRAIVRAIAERDARVELVEIDALPRDWLGKTHACQRGAERASGEWLLFADADVWLAPDTIARAIAAAHSTDADHVTLTVELHGASTFGLAGVCAFGAAMLGELAAANRDDPKSGVGIGAFNLVRAEAWRTIGGHVRLALEVVDDLRLGLLLRRAGFRTRAFLGSGEVGVVWARSVWGVVRVLEKNFFAQLGYSVAKALAIALVLLGVWLAALLGPIVCTLVGTGTLAGWCAFGALLGTLIPGVIGGRRQRFPLLPVLLSPFFVFVLPLAIVNSTWKTVSAGGVRWRDTFYPLRELRARRVV